VRYDHEAPWKEAFNRITDFSETAPSPLQAPGLNVVGGLEFPGIGGLPRTQFNPSWANVWPRLGFAYRLDNTTVIRGGFGGFTSSISGTGYNSIAAISGFLASTPWINSLNGVNPVNVLSNPFPNGFVYATGSTLGLGTLLGQSVGAMVRDRPFAYALDWNFGVERTLRGNWVLHVAYSASRGVHLYEDPTLDQLPDKYLSEGSALTQLVTNPFYGNPLVTTGILSGPQIEASQLLLPYPQFSQVSITGESFGTSTYNSLQVNLEHRFTNGFHLHTAYTYSKTMDDCAPSQTQFPGGTFEGGGIQDWSDRKGSWSPAVWDTPNNFETDGVYELPFGPKRHLLNQGGALGKVVGGWQLGGIITLQNGSPLSFTTATNTLNNNGASGQGWAGAGSQFPSLTGVSPKLSGSASSKVNEWFNPAAFTQPAPFTYGNVGRTLSWLRGPGYANVDFSLDKTTTISERFSLQFRAEAFNAFNHPWFGLPDTTIGAPGAGVISEQQNSARQIQFALKLLF
jgi:hypothetical protein